VFLGETNPNRTQARLGSKRPARREPTFRACTGSYPFGLCSSPAIDVTPAAPRYPDPRFSANLSGMRTYKNSGANSLRMRTYETKDLNPFRIRTYKMDPRGVPLAPLVQRLLKNAKSLESYSCTNRAPNRPGITLLTLKVGGRGISAHLTCQTFSCDPSSLPHLKWEQSVP
jgi:hypothetical protein